MKKLISSLLAFAMVLALFSGVVIFNAAADDEVEMHIPFINQYTLEQAQKMGKSNGWAGSNNYSNASGYSITKDDQGRTVISCTLAEGLSDQWKTNTAYLSTGTNATPFVKDGLIDGINIFGDAELSNKTKIAIKIDGDANFKSAFTGINLMFNSASEDYACLSLQGPTKSNGYLIYDFTKITRNNYDKSGIALPKDAGNFGEAYDGRISTLNMAIVFNKTTLPVTFWFEDVYLVGSTDSVALHKAIRESKEADVDAALIAAAEEVYKDPAATQEQVDAAAKTLNDALAEIKFGYDKVKKDLNDLLDAADALGFFDSTYKRYDEVNYADSVYSSTTTTPTLDELLVQVRIVRDCIAEELLDAPEYAAFAKCNNVWRHNYTKSSYNALSAAIDEAWAVITSDAKAPIDDAIATLNAAYDALVPASTKSVTADFFAGWTTTMVNDVVDANSGKLCDSIGDGLNIKDVWNAGDFTRNTVFEADNNFSMTALADFAGKSMGWKNMDRSGTLATDGAGYGYPAMNVAGLSKADGIRLKIEVEGGNVQRLLIGLSNCANMTREQYALYLSPDLVDEEGYINIPFSYFVNAWWCKAFSQAELENVIVLIVEAYGVDDDTVITLSDLRGYQAIGESVDKSKLKSLIDELAAIDTNVYDSELEAARTVFNDAMASQGDVDEQVMILTKCINNYYNPPINGYSYTQLVGVQDWTADDVAKLNLYGDTFALSDKGLIGKATQSVELTVKDNTSRYCITTNLAAGGFLSKNPFRFADESVGYKLSDFEGLAVAFSDADGKPLNVNKVTARLMRSSADWGEYWNFEANYTDVDAIYENGYYHIKFEDYAKLANGEVDNLSIPSLLFFVSPMAAGDKAYVSDFCAYTYDPNYVPPEPPEPEAELEYVQLNGVQKWTAAEVATINTFGASYALSDKGLIGNATQSLELTVTDTGRARFCLATQLKAGGFLANNPFTFADESKGYKLSDFDGIAIAFSDADGKELPITQFQCRLMRNQDDWNNYWTFEANYYNMNETYKNGYYHLKFSDYPNLANGAINDIAILSVLFYRNIAIGDKAYISDIVAYREKQEFVDPTANLWEYNYTADSWAAYETAIATATTPDEITAAVALLVPLNVKPVTGNFMEGWTTKDVNDVVTANSGKLCDSIGEGLNINNAWNAGDFSNNTTFTADSNFSMTATADFTGKAMGWKNMDRSQTLQPDKDGAYPALNVAGLSKAEGIRFKLEANKPVERILIGLSNCSKFVREMYAMKIKPEYTLDDGYINIPFSYFEKAFWCSAFAQDELEDVIVFIIEAYGAEEGTTITVSDLRGYVTYEPLDPDKILAETWEYNYTAESYAAFTAALAAATNDEEIEAAVALLVPLNVKPVTGNFFEGWTTKDVNDVVTANSGKLCDSIGEGLNINNAWNAGDFSNNTTFTADSNFSMTATADFTGKAMGWKNMDRSQTLQPDKDGAYPALNVAGLSKAEGIRFKLEANKPVERILIGLSNCSKFVREMYAMKIKPEYTLDDGYINIPFSYFEKAFWCSAFAQDELEDVIVFIIEAYGAEEGTTITVSDLRGYKTIEAPTDADFEALEAAVTALKAFDFDGTHFAELYALAEEVATATDRDVVLDATEQISNKTEELGAVGRAAIKAKIEELEALDVDGNYADEIASFKDRYYGELDQAAADKLLADVQACIDLFSIPEPPAAPTAVVVEAHRVVLETIEGAEYKCGDGEWQKSTAFSGLDANTEYTFYARYYAQGTIGASESSEGTVVKTAKDEIAGSVTITGDMRYGTVATAEVELTLAGNYDLVIDWYTTAGKKLGTGETYTFAADDIGATVFVKVSSASLDGELQSDTFGPIGKGLVTVTELPVADKLPLGMTLANCVLTGGVTSVEGVWAFADPDVIPEYEQSGSEFDLVFTPNDTDLYEVYATKLAVEINAVTEFKAVVNNDNGMVELSGDFHNTAVTTFEMTKITTANKTAYIELLRAANRSGSEKNIIFMYTIDFNTPIAPYIGTLTFKAEVGDSRVGETYTVWFFTKDGVVSREGVIDLDGNVTVHGLKF